MGAALMQGAPLMHGSVRVHGLGSAPEPSAWPKLTVAELAPILRAWPAVGAVRAVDWHSPRPFAASGIVAGRAGQFFVKRHDGRVRSVADLAEEHAFIAHLRGAGVSAPDVLRTLDGASSVAVGGQVYEVHALAAGQDLYRDAVSWSPILGAAHAHAAGACLARLHVAAADFAAPARRTGLLVADFSAFGAPDPLAVLEARLAGDSLLAAALASRPWRQDIARVLLPSHARLAASPGKAPLWCHNDLHASNLLWHGTGAAAQVATILDFGLANRTSAAFDLATAIERNAIAWLELAEGSPDIGRADLARALIGGYRTVRAVPPALAEILPVVHAEFALSELAYFHGILGAQDKADAAYDEFLLGHAAWFSTPHGADFLQAIRDAV